MQWLWTWKEESFGYRHNDELRLKNGTHVGTFIGDEVFDFDGTYLGEIKSENRLITKKSSRNKKGPRSSKKSKLAGTVDRVNFVGYVNLVDFENFPNSEDFQN